jgi:hypothetical protein
VLHERFDAGCALDAIAAYGVMWMYLAPIMVRGLAAIRASTRST